MRIRFLPADTFFAFECLFCFFANKVVIKNKIIKLEFLCFLSRLLSDNPISKIEPEAFKVGIYSLKL